jgi:hypothetical protein
LGYWAQRKLEENRAQAPRPPIGSSTVEERIRAFREAKRNGLVRQHQRSRSKQLKDKLRQETRLERHLESKRLFDEAIRGRDEARGEVVAGSSSGPLDVSKGDVLLDRRIHGLPGGYVHPSLRHQPIVITTKDMVDSIRKKTQVRTQTLKGNESKQRGDSCSCSPMCLASIGYLRRLPRTPSLQGGNPR